VVSINGRSVFVQDYSRVKMGIIEKLRSWSVVGVWNDIKWCFCYLNWCNL
jgi:hypothetical protein